MQSVGMVNGPVGGLAQFGTRPLGRVRRKPSACNAPTMLEPWLKDPFPNYDHDLVFAQN